MPLIFLLKRKENTLENMFHFLQQRPKPLRLRRTEVLLRGKTGRGLSCTFEIPEFCQVEKAHSQIAESLRSLQRCSRTVVCLCRCFSLAADLHHNPLTNTHFRKKCGFERQFENKLWSPLDLFVIPPDGFYSTSEGRAVSLPHCTIPGRKAGPGWEAGKCHSQAGLPWQASERCLPT